MEKEGLRRSLDLLRAHGVTFDSIVTDRHPQTQKQGQSEWQSGRQFLIISETCTHMMIPFSHGVCIRDALQRTRASS